MLKSAKCASGIWLALLCSLSSAVIAQEQTEQTEQNGSLLSDPKLDHVSEYWSPYNGIEAAEAAAIAASTTTDEELTPAQMLAAPSLSRPTRMAQRPRRSAVARRNQNLASIPFMIGDTTAGNCISYGGVAFNAIGHPTLGCSRLNISESNTPLPTDRVYFSYRHFANASPSNVSFFPQNFDLERYTMAGERTFFDGMMSAEIRLPIEYRLASDIESNIVTFDPSFIPGATPGISPIVGGRETELANISLIFKALLLERKDYAVSAGLGVTLPTAQDVTYNSNIDTILDQNGVQLRNISQISSVAANETVYLAPFLSWMCKPSKRFFHQGFFQVEVAANPSRVHTNAVGGFTADFNGDTVFDPTDPTDGTLTFFSPSLPLTGGFGSGVVTQDLNPQVLMRLNLGFGYVMYENQRADWIQRLTGLFEAHYTGTLSDANISEAGLNTFFNGFFVPPTDPIFDNPAFADFRTINVGNELNQIHIVNLTAGISANMGDLVVTHGFTAPVTNDQNRGFDFEYNLQIQRPF